MRRLLTFATFAALLGGCAAPSIGPLGTIRDGVAVYDGARTLQDFNEARGQEIGFAGTYEVEISFPGETFRMLLRTPALALVPLADMQEQSATDRVLRREQMDFQGGAHFSVGGFAFTEEGLSNDVNDMDYAALIWVAGSQDAGEGRTSYQALILPVAEDDDPIRERFEAYFGDALDDIVYDGAGAHTLIVEPDGHAHFEIRGSGPHGLATIRGRRISNEVVDIERHDIDMRVIAEGMRGG